MSNRRHEKKIEVFDDPKGMPYIEIGEPSDKMRDIILNVMNDNTPDSEAHKLRDEAGAVLETDGDDEIRIEFANPNPQPFVEFLNRKLNG